MSEYRHSSSPHVQLIQTMLDNALNNLNTIIPGQVAEYDKNTGRAKVRPMNKIVLNRFDENGKRISIEIPALDNIPVCFFGSPEVRLTHTVKKGDTGLLLVCQRSVDEFLAASLANPENPDKIVPYQASSLRKFDINDALFFPAYFGGDKDFSGITAKDPTGKVEIGTTGATIKKAKIESKQMNLLELVDDLQSQVDVNRRNIRTVAGTSPWTAPSLGAVLGGEITSKIKHALNVVKKEISYEKTSLAILKAGLIAGGLKALKVIVENGIPKVLKEDPGEIIEEMDKAPPLEVAVRQKKFSQGTFLNYDDNYGWCLPGLNNLEIGDFFPDEGRGMADFSSLSRIDKQDLGLKFEDNENQLIWADLVSVVFSHPGNGPLRMNCYWLAHRDLSKSSVKRIRVFTKDYETDDVVVIGCFDIPSATGNLTTSAAIKGVSIDSDRTNNGLGADGRGGADIAVTTETRYLEAFSGFSIFGTNDELKYPALTFWFYDADDKRIEVPVPNEETL